MKANIFSFAPTARRHRITYDSNVEDAFMVHTDGGIIKFQNVDDLYVFVPDPIFLERNKQLMSVEHVSLG